MHLNRDQFNLKEHCHVNSNNDGDRFVGFTINSDNVAINFPLGYELPSSNEEIKKDVKNLLQILTLYTEKKDRLLEMDKFSKLEYVEFPIRAYLNVINYYLEHNGSYYTEKETVFKIDSKGKTNWSKTIKTQKPFIQNDSAVYLKQVVRNSTPNINKLITKIHKYCVYESFEKIGWLYTNHTPDLPDINFHKVLFISILNTKLQSTNNDSDKLLFRSMISMIEFMDDKSNDKQLYFGTDKFETVWEKVIDKYFGVSNKKEYFPRASWIEYSKGSNVSKKTHALEPDTIMIYKDNFYILDAKFYRYGVYSDLGIQALPQSSDINKQITYGQYVKNNKANENNKVFNAFIMPFNRLKNKYDESAYYLNIAEAIGDWVTNPETFERIQGILVDIRYILKNIDGNHDKDKELLSAEIEKVLARNLVQH